MLSKEEIAGICRAFHRVNPDPKIELEYVNNFTLLVAIILSAQSTDKMVNRCTTPLFKVCTTPEEVVAMGQDSFREYIRYIGLFRNKTKHVFAMSHAIIKNHNSQVPDNFRELIKLPGVGTKTANVFLNTAFKQPVIGVDRHILRIVPKIGIAQGLTPDEIMKELYKVIPEEYHRQIHHWLVLHGRYICKAQKQLCKQCPIADICKANGNKGN